MESLQTYISNVDPRLLGHVTGKMGELIRAVQEQNFISEEALLVHICQNKKERKYYHNLKSRTLKMLQALAIVSTSQGANEVKKKLDLCRKNFTVGQKFLGNGERKEGLRLIKQAYRIAIDYDFIHMACELCSILYHDHVYYHPNKRKASFYEFQADRYARDYGLEKKAEHHFYRVVGYINGALPKVDFETIIEQLDDLQGQSLKFKIYHAMIKVLYGFEVGNHLFIIQTCTTIIKEINDRKGVYRSHHQFFRSKSGLAYLALTQYKEAEERFSQAALFAPRKSVNDYLLRLYRTINALHAGYYQTAYDLYKQNKKCRFEMIREQFAIIEAYMGFLSHMGYVQLDKTFRIGKYLNDTFKAQSDKQGSNITIIIAELLVYLARDKGKFIDRVESVNTYSYRHLKGQDCIFRSL